MKRFVSYSEKTERTTFYHCNVRTVLFDNQEINHFLIWFGNQRLSLFSSK